MTSISLCFLAADPETYKSDLVDTLNNLGVLDQQHSRLNKAHKEYAEVLQIYEALAAQDPQIFSADVARVKKRPSAFSV